MIAIHSQIEKPIDEPLPCESCHWRDILASIGWFEGPLFMANLSDELCELLDKASEKHNLTGAELLEVLLRNDLT
jgi:hypothetical protein